MDIVLVNERNFGERTKFFLNDGVVQRENEKRRTWIVQRNEKTITFWKGTKKLKRMIWNCLNVLEKTIGLPNERISQKIFKMIVIY